MFKYNNKNYNHDKLDVTWSQPSYKEKYVNLENTWSWRQLPNFNLSMIDIEKPNNLIKGNILEIVWEGKETMSKTFWLYCILATLVVSFISGLLLASLGAMIFIAPVIMIIWSNTGLWRSSEIYKNEKLNNKQTYGWATAAKTYVVINYITTLSQIGLSLNS